MAQCQHDGCTCHPKEGDKYCSDECKNAQNSAYCTCGHSGCGGKKK